MNNREHRLKNKWTEPQWQVGHYQVVKLYVTGISEEEYTMEQKKISELLMDKKFSNLMKNICNLEMYKF